MQKAGKLICSLLIYSAFSAYLFYPHIEKFHILDYLLIINPIIGAAGCYILSRRWTAGFVGSLFAGAVYGFGPLALSLGGFHPTAGSIAATIPWLFLPAVFGPYGKTKWISIPLTALPFAVIICFFVLADLKGLYPMSTQLRIQTNELYSLLAPAALVNKADVSIGFYHIPIASLIIGATMSCKAKRYGMFLVFAMGLGLCFCPVIFGVSPIIWLTVPTVCCSIFIGEGTEGLIHSGYNDRKWLLASTIILLLAGTITIIMGKKSTYIIAGLGAEYTRQFIEAAKMYILGAIATVVVFFLAKGKTRLLWIRLGIFCSALAVDIFLGARYIVDSIHS